MTIDPSLFRQLLSQLPTGVTVVAVSVDGGVRAMTVGSFTSVSLDPPLVLFCVAKRAKLAAAIDTGRSFSVNVLRAEQQPLSTYFAGSWKAPTSPPHRLVPWGATTRLEGAAVSLSARVASVVDGGDHLIVIGAVDDVHRGVGPIEPLVFFDRHYHTLDLGAGEAAPELEARDGSAQLIRDLPEFS
jgi:flavin reductase (DIM6/NTAB) family NADH-FMN oxidoreductase RutF